VRSREPESVREEIKELVDKGVKEIILTGTHLGAYGTDWGKEDSLEQLLQELVKIDGLEHIRLSSIEVTEITEGLIDILATEQKVCPHLHLPLQSGSDKILKLMRRPYSTAEFRAMVEKLRERIKDIAITTDVIVGFPGEDEEAFQENYNFVKEMAFSRLHVFPFSKREGTPAARMGEQVSAEQKKIYSNKMLALNEELMLEYQSRFLGTVRPVIVEEKRDQETKLLTGMTDNYLRVLVDADETYMGQLVKVKLLKSHSHETVIGEIV